jgi:hypothetical protein
MRKAVKRRKFSITDDAMSASAFYLVGLKKMEQQSKKCFELRWEYDECQTCS